MKPRVFVYGSGKEPYTSLFSQKRILELDLIRAFAIILIVFSHIPTYSIDPAVKWWASVIGVSLFIFISGMVLHPGPHFYRKRAQRIYPAYLIIVGVYVLLQYGFPDVANTLGIYLQPWQILVNAAGLQGLLNVPSYGVLWFVGVILAYYLVYPFIRRSWGHALVIFFAFTALHQFGLIIPQMIIYYPLFVAGIAVGMMGFKGRLQPSTKLKPILLISKYSYQIYLTHMLIIGFIVLLFSSAAVGPIVVVNNTTTTTTAVVTGTATPLPPHKEYTLYYFTMAAACPAGVEMQAQVTEWAHQHPAVKFYVLPQGTELGAKYDDRLSPTTVLLLNGELVGRWVGIFPIERLDVVYNQ